MRRYSDQNYEATVLWREIELFGIFPLCKENTKWRAMEGAYKFMNSAGKVHRTSFFIIFHNTITRQYTNVFLNSTELNFGMRHYRRWWRPKACIDFKITISGYWSEAKTLKPHTKQLFRVQSPVQEGPEWLIAGDSSVRALVTPRDRIMC